jgi:hypothetical protein
MRRSFVLVLGFAAALAAAMPVVSRAGDDAAAGLAALQKRYEEAPGSYPEKFAAVKAEYEAFAKANAGTEPALEAKLFLLQQTWWEREKGTMNASAAKLVDEILAEYPRSPLLWRIVGSQFVLAADKKREVFAKLATESPHDAVKAEALLGLAMLDRRSKDDTAKAAAAARLDELSAKYGKVLRRGVTPYAEIAESIRSPHDPKDLETGKAAPEIVGRDLDGRPMKLSDFRGKVVVLDFWGDW